MPRRRHDVAATSITTQGSINTMKTPASNIATPPTKPRRRYHPRIAKKPQLSRHQIADDIAAALGLSSNKARYVLDVVLKAIKTRVRAGHSVELRGLVKFEVVNKKARERIDMADVKAGLVGAAVRRFTVPAHAVVKATASPRFLSVGDEA